MSTTSQVTENAEEIPMRIRRAVKGLAGDKQFAITVALLKNGGMSFSELQEDLGLHQQTLSRTLDKMQEGGLVSRTEVIDLGRNQRTEYRVSEFGKNFLDSLYDSIQPHSSPAEPERDYEEAREAEHAGEFFSTNPTKARAVMERTSVDDAVASTGVGGSMLPNQATAAPSE